MTTVKNRRDFLFGVAGSLAAGSLLSRRAAMAAARKMKMDLHTGNIGVKASLQQQIDYAAKYGFEAVDLYYRWRSGDTAARDKLARYCCTDAAAVMVLSAHLLKRKGVDTEPPALEELCKDLSIPPPPEPEQSLWI